jgi:hypothetical protein
VEEAARAIQALSPEQGREGARLSHRHFTVELACDVLSGEYSPPEEQRALILAWLRGVERELREEFVRYSESVGVPTFFED